MIPLFLTVEETAEYLQCTTETVESLIRRGKIRAIHDGSQYLLNKEQFATHMEQIELYKKQYEEWLAEPLPEDLDIKDED